MNFERFQILSKSVFLVFVHKHSKKIVFVSKISACPHFLTLWSGDGYSYGDINNNCYLFMAIFDDVVCDSSLNKKELYCQGGVQRDYSFDRAACESEKLRKKELWEIMFERGLGQCGKSEKRALRQKWVSAATTV